jgi:hypothetical protein
LLSRALRIFVLVVGLLLLTFPVINMIRPLYVERPIEGALVEARRPDIDPKAISNEDFQRQFTKWFEQQWGLRATMARLDNSFNYYALHEARPDKHVQVGKDDTLFLDEQIWFYNRNDDAREASKAFAKLARLVQDALAERGKEILFLLLPAKPTLFPDAFPSRWRLDLNNGERKRPCDGLVYEPWVEAMTRESVHFVDGRQLVASELADKRDLAYVKTGRHLNGPAACLVLDKGLALLPKYSIPPLDCRYTRVLPETSADEEADLLRLLNIWNDKPRESMARTMPIEDPDPDREAERPRTLVVGSSFSWTLVKEANRNHALGRIIVLYYNKTVCVRDEGMVDYLRQYEKPPVQSEEWRQLVLEDNDLFLLPLPEEYLALHNADFLMELAEALAIDISPFKKALTPN